MIKELGLVVTGFAHKLSELLFEIFITALAYATGIARTLMDLKKRGN